MRRAVIGVIILSSVALLHADHWPQWRGPAQNGVSRETNLPVRWSKSENIAWRLEMPAWSGSTAIVWGDRVTGHDAATGKELWRAGGLNPYNSGNYRIVASPIVFGDMIYAPTRERPMLALRAGGRGDVTRSHLVWSFDSGPDVPTPVTDGTYLYVVRDNGVMFCLDAKTGTRIYGPRRLAPAAYSGSLVLADGKIYVTNEDGVTVVVKAGPVFEMLAENDLGGFTLSSPAISDGQIFIRTDEALYAIGKRIQHR